MPSSQPWSNSSTTADTLVFSRITLTLASSIVFSATRTCNGALPSGARGPLLTRKYQSNGGPGIVKLLDLLKGSDTPGEDQAMLLKAQIFFWLIGATDGHAKNFSIFLAPGGRYHLTPLYDVLTAQPSLDTGQIQRKQMELAMSVGTNNHYRIAEVQGRHFVQTGEAAGVPKKLVQESIEAVAATAEAALVKIENELPMGFPEAIHTSVQTAAMQRLRSLKFQ
ncbi:HipA domain-containing protein [Bradyrhizobium sp. 170]|nr:HipA domain-containing protein [Bradyrhizobium sp. 170]